MITTFEIHPRVVSDTVLDRLQKIDLNGVICTQSYVCFTQTKKTMLALSQYQHCLL